MRDTKQVVNMTPTRHQHNEKAAEGKRDTHVCWVSQVCKSMVLEALSFRHIESVSTRVFWLVAGIASISFSSR